MDIAQYGRDGCTRLYPGRNFVREWDSSHEQDPGREGFMAWNKQIFLDDSAAKTKRSHDFMIGLIADDIEATPGYNRKAAREPDKMILVKEFRDAIAARHQQFFGSPNPTADE
eukprot:5520924-Heterocapsa_arctica.AAC.1